MMRNDRYPDKSKFSEHSGFCAAFDSVLMCSVMKEVNSRASALAFLKNLLRTKYLVDTAGAQQAHTGERQLVKTLLRLTKIFTKGVEERRIPGPLHGRGVYAVFDTRKKKST